jgi:hypothetical protein
MKLVSVEYGRSLLLVVALLSQLPCNYAAAQWKEQTITLNPGWNAVFLEVDPVPNTPATVFSGLPVESVWAWNRRFETVQFVRNASELSPEDPEWLVYFDASGANRGASTLFAVHSRPLLIKLAGSEPTTWTVTGKPNVSPTKWISNSFNLVGFHLDGEAPPKFSEFFAADAALAGQPVHQLAEDGRWKRVENPGSEAMQPGRAYWVYCDGTTTFSGGLEIQLETGDGMYFGQSLVEQSLLLRNTSPTARTVSLVPRSSAAAPETETAVAGDIVLNYWAFSEAGSWLPLPGGHSVTVAAGGEARVRLEASRPATGGSYQSLLNIANGAGLSVDVPVSASGIGSDGTKGSAVHARAGLWIGTVAINKVNFIASDIEGEREDPVPTASEFQFRILVHVDAEGRPRLLQQVIQMWRPGTTNTDGTVAEPGEFVLLTDESRIGEFQGATLRDVVPAGRRFSTAAFGFKGRIDMTGAFPSPMTPETSIEGEVILPYNDPLNPFFHRYHPDHDNLDFNFEEYTGNPEQESFTVTRILRLDFSAEDPEGLAIAGWGDTQIGGTYLETIAGIHKDELRVEGIFRLQHASRVKDLDPES